MTFREIDDALLSLVDHETGEILDIDAFEALQMERHKKAENMALWVLDLKDEVASIDNEIKRLKERKESTERKIDSLKRYLPIITHGEKMKTPLVSVSYRTNSAVEVFDKDMLIKWAQQNNLDDVFLRYAEPEISKTAVKKAINEGGRVPGAAIIENLSTIIK